MSEAPTTVRGYDSREVVSALQKCIRRGEAEAAVYWAAELDPLGFGAWAWKRLRVICSEDSWGWLGQRDRRELARAAVEAGGPQADAEPSPQQSLFE